MLTANKTDTKLYPVDQIMSQKHWLELVNLMQTLLIQKGKLPSKSV